MQDSKKLFNDPFNPTKEELQIWAYGDYVAPEQDFQLYVVDDPLFVLKLTTDSNCPTRDFFLGSLYIWTAEQIIHKSNLHAVENVLQSAEKSSEERVKKFITRSRELLQNPESYTYANWGLGGEFTKNE